MNECELKKDNCFTNDVIFIDGLWGTGKSIIAPIISAMEGIEKQKIEHIYEYLCILNHMKKIQPDAVSTLLKTYADLSQYNNCVGREVNLRLNDDSGFFNNPGSMKYVKRLFGREGNDVVTSINNNNLALNVMSHMILPVSEPLFQSYGERLKIIEMVRHPLYLVKHWYSFLSRFEDSRIFTLSSTLDNIKVPWFAYKWDTKYASDTLMDRVLSSIIFMYEWLFAELDKCAQQKRNVFVISFENFVIKPYPVLEELKKFLNRDHFSKVDKILRKQKIPRQQISNGLGHAIYDWNKNNTHNEEDEYFSLLGNIKHKGSKDNLSRFNHLIDLYNTKWPSLLDQYQYQ